MFEGLNIAKTTPLEVFEFRDVLGYSHITTRLILRTETYTQNFFN